VDYADLPVVDLNQAQTPEGRAELAIQVREAMSKHGFLYVVNHGYSKVEVWCELSIYLFVSCQRSKKNNPID
jgi:isopenicillin N synthase-like dioxygenase